MKPSLCLFHHSVLLLLLWSQSCFNVEVYRPTAKPSERSKNNKFDVGIADDQARDFDFVATEMKYDSTGMFHWTPSRPIDDCILVRQIIITTTLSTSTTLFRIVTRRP